MDTKERSRTPSQKKRSAPANANRRRSGTISRSGSTANTKKSSSSVGTRSKRTQTAAAVKSKTRRTATVKQPAPDVVYTQPVPFNKYRFLLQIATIVAVVLALLFGMSIFFKVKTVTVIGNAKYTAWDIREASGIQDGENLLTISEPRISNNIKSKLPYVDYIRVGIKLPDTVKIEIVELDVVYAVEAEDGSWWLIRSDGGIVEKTNSADAQQHTKILGVKIAQPVSGGQAVAMQHQQSTEDGETVPVTVLASEQLQTAVNIAQFLEDSGVIGEVASIDVTNPGDLELWYGSRYQVTLGDAMELGYKIKSMKSAIDQMGDYQSGVLDVSFTTWPEEVGYTPFP